MTSESEQQPGRWMRWPRRVRLGLVVLPAGLFIFYLASRFPVGIERVYSTGVYPLIAGTLARVSSLVPFSIAEPVFAAVGLVLAVSPLVAITRARKRGERWPRALLAAAAHGLGEAGWIWCLFLALWGLNYARERPAALFGLEEPLELDRQAALHEAVGRRLDLLREQMQEDAIGVAVIPGSLAELDARIGPLQDAVLRDAGLPLVAGGRAKRILSSRLLLRYGAAGVYGPFTGEPNVILPAVPCRLPFVIAHERAHHAGFAWEEAASFVALLTLWEADDPALRYAGWLSLWVVLGGSPEGRSPGVRRDLAAIRDFIERHVSRRESRRFRRAYGAFLEAHGVTGGAASYARAGELALRFLDDRGHVDPLPTEMESKEAADGDPDR